MTIIIPTKGSATSGLLDVWQSHLQQQQADKAQAVANASGAASPANGANAAGATASAANAANATNAANTGDASTNNGTNSRRIDTNMVDMVRGARDGAKQTGQAVSATPDSGGGGDAIVAQTIKKLKDMLAKVMAQLDAVRNNDRLPPEDKLQQTTALSAQAMSIQAQIMALMDPTRTSGTHVDTTA
ncbi:MAG: hypothetical protein P4M06_01650 [Pandoraea sp.]|nr:FlxA-like family protein [Pandoraea sp.]MDR3396247.1 hypothetical protein [Pandoraea sp.]